MLEVPVYDVAGKQTGKEKVDPGMADGEGFHGCERRTWAAGVRQPYAISIPIVT